VWDVGVAVLLWSLPLEGGLDDVSDVVRVDRALGEHARRDRLWDEERRARLHRPHQPQRYMLRPSRVVIDSHKTKPRAPCDAGRSDAPHANVTNTSATTAAAAEQGGTGCS
jgi:hypothetical protein